MRNCRFTIVDLRSASLSVVSYQLAAGWIVLTTENC